MSFQMKRKLITVLFIIGGTIALSAFNQKTAKADLLLDPQPTTSSGQPATLYKGVGSGTVNPDGTITAKYEEVIETYKDYGTHYSMSYSTNSNIGFMVIPNYWGSALQVGDTFDVGEYDSDGFTDMQSGKLLDVWRNWQPITVQTQKETRIDTPNNSVVSNSVVISGWATNSTGVSHVNISVDGKQVTSANTGIYRPDVEASYPNYGDYSSGYSYTLDTSGWSKGNHTINVTAVGKDGTTDSKSITIVKPNTVSGIDQSSQIVIGSSTTVTGWAMDMKGIKEIDMSVDGTTVGTTTTTLARADIEKSYPVYSTLNSGYSYTLDTSKLSNGMHTVTATAVATDGDISTQTMALFKTDATSNVDATYQGYVQNIGWQDWVSDGAEAGTDGQSLRVEAVKIQLNNMLGYSIYYRANVKNVGWQSWVKDGQEAGTDGQGLRIEALEIRIVKIANGSTPAPSAFNTVINKN